MMRLSCGAILLMVAVLLPAGSGAQEVITVPADAEAYCRCGPTLERVVTLGEFDGLGALTAPVKAVRRDSQGILYALSWREDEVFRFGANGEPLPSIGGGGQGPGEAQYITSFDLVGDSIVVFDSGNARVTLYSPQGDVVWTSPSLGGSASDAAYVPGHGFVINGNYSGPQRWGIPLHLHSLTGDYTRSFGGRGIVRIDAPFLWFRRVAAAGDRVWAAYRNQYSFERWSLDGEHELTIKRQTDWFAPYLTVSWGGPDEPRDPTVLDVIVDRRGMLRTLVGRASPHWAERLPEPRRNVVGDLVYPIPEGIGLFESVLEIIDPSSGRLYASSVLNQELYGFIDEEHVFSYSEEPDGVPRVTVWRIRLATAPPSPSSGGSS